MKRFEESVYFRVGESFRLPRFNELPDLRLYVDQVMDLMARMLSPILGDEQEKWLTATMIGNYVKQGVAPRPDGKRYTREHVAHLVFLCMTKQVLSISEIQELFAIRRRSDYTMEIAYDYFCTEFESIFAHVFNDTPLRPDSARTHALETSVLRSAGFAVAHRIYLRQYLMYMHDVMALEQEPNA